MARPGERGEAERGIDRGVQTNAREAERQARRGGEGAQSARRLGIAWWRGEGARPFAIPFGQQQLQGRRSPLQLAGRPSDTAPLHPARWLDSYLPPYLDSASRSYRVGGDIPAALLKSRVALALLGRVLTPHQLADGVAVSLYLSAPADPRPQFVAESSLHSLLT